MSAWPTGLVAHVAPPSWLALRTVSAESCHQAGQQWHPHLKSSCFPPLTLLRPCCCCCCPAPECSCKEELPVYGAPWLFVFIPSFASVIAVSRSRKPLIPPTERRSALSSIHSKLTPRNGFGIALLPARLRTLFLPGRTGCKRTFRLGPIVDSRDDGCCCWLLPLAADQ